MEKSFQLWSASSGNALGVFDRPGLAAVLVDYVRLNGPDSLDDLFAEEWSRTGSLNSADLRIIAAESSFKAGNPQ